MNDNRSWKFHRIHVFYFFDLFPRTIFLVDTRQSSRPGVTIGWNWSRERVVVTDTSFPRRGLHRPHFFPRVSLSLRYREIYRGIPIYAFSGYNLLILRIQRFHKERIADLIDCGYCYITIFLSLSLFSFVKRNCEWFTIVLREGFRRANNLFPRNMIDFIVIYEPFSRTSSNERMIDKLTKWWRESQPAIEVAGLRPDISEWNSKSCKTNTSMDITKSRFDQLSPSPSFSL